MNRRIALSVLLTSSLTCLAARGEPAPVKFPTGDAAWTVEVSYPSAKPPENTAPQIKKVEIVRKAGIRRNHLTWSNGDTSETWVLDSLGVQVLEDPKNHGTYVISKHDATETFLVSINFDGTLFEWITHETSKGGEDYGGKKCVRYEAMIAPKQLPSQGGSKNTLPPVLHKAWIDEETSLPVALDDGASLNKFTFLPVPTEPLAMPEKLSAQLKQYEAAVTPLRRLKNGK